MRNIKDSTFPENILEEIGINKVSEKKNRLFPTNR